MTGHTISERNKKAAAHTRDGLRLFFSVVDEEITVSGKLLSWLFSSDGCKRPQIPVIEE